MPFTHYPKLEENLFLFATWYGKGDPRNSIQSPLDVGGGVNLYGCAQNFTRFYGTIYCDQPLAVEFDFGNEDVVPAFNPATLPDGSVVDMGLPDDVRPYFPVGKLTGLRAITDEDLLRINYDGKALVTNYQPAVSPGAPIGDKFLVTIYGRWMRVCIANKGDKPVSSMRVFVRASVF